MIPNLELKLGRPVLGPERLKRLRETSRFVSEIANLALDSRAIGRDEMAVVAAAFEIRAHQNSIQPSR